MTTTLDPRTAVRPTNDPAASRALEEAIERVSRETPGYDWMRAASNPHIFRQQLDDRTRVPQAVFDRFMNLSHRLGYNVATPWLGEHRNGYLSGQTTGYPNFQIQVHRGHTPAQQARTFAHELGHVILRHVPKNAYEDRLMDMQGGHREQWEQEVAVEMAAFAVGTVAGFHDGVYSRDNIAQKLRGRRVPQSVKDAALLAARVLWAALAGETA